MKHHLSALPLVLACLLVASCGRKVELSEYAVIPEPAYLLQKGRTFDLTPSTKICFENLGQNTATAKYITTSLRQMHIRPALIGAPDENTITFKLNDSVNTEIGDEGYLLLVRPEGILVSANTEAGLFYAYQTFMQMLPSDVGQHKYRRIVMPECTILDYPRFGWRGSHLDVSRHFFSVQQVKKHLDLMAAYKLNKFHWHLTDDHGWRIETDCYPELNDIGSWRVERPLKQWDNPAPPKPGEEPTYGGYYSKAEIAEIVKYAADRHIEVIPEIELPGHCSAILAAYPELACDDYPYTVAIGSYWPPKAILCAGNPKTLDFLFQVLDEVTELFPSQFIHIGGDEAWKDNWKKCPKCQSKIRQLDLANEEQLQGWLVGMVEQHLAEKGKRIVGWDEMLDCGMVSQNAIVMAWRGYKPAETAARRGNDVIMTPTEFCYLDYCQSDQKYQPRAFQAESPMTQTYRFDPMPAGLPAEEQHHILGGQANLWTERIATSEHAEYMLLPRLCAIAECLWSLPEKKDWKQFQHKIETHKTLLRIRGYNVCNGSFRPTVTKVRDGNEFVVTLVPEVEGTYLYYTTDGSAPSPESELYVGPLRLAPGIRLRTVALYRGKLQEGVYDFIIK